MENTNLTINKIDIKTANRQNVDIESWRSATRSADKGKRKSLYDLYEDLMLDNILSEAIDKRVTAIVNAEITFTKNEKVVDQIDTLMDSEGFEKIIREIMMAKFWGVTLLEFEFLPEGIKVHSIPRKHIRASRKQVAINEGDEGGLPYTEDFFLEVGQPNDLGRILNAAPFVIYKRNNMGDWAQYNELYGMPIRTAYYDVYDDNIRVELTRAMEAAGSALSNVLPKGCDFKVEPGAASGDGTIYDNLRKACNEEILIGILGQTMTTTDGSSLAQGQVHMQTQSDKHKADRRFVQRILNSKLIPILAKRGYPVEGGYFYFPEAGQTVSMVDRIGIDMQLSRIIPMGTQHFYDTYGIPRPDDGDELISAPQESDLAIQEAEAIDAKNLLNRLRRFFVEAPFSGALQNKIPSTISSEIDLNADNDPQAPLIKRVARGESSYFDSTLFADLAGDLVEAFDKGWSGGIKNSLDVEYGAQCDAVITANQTNLYHFAAAKTLVEIQGLNQLYRDSKSFEEYYARASELCGKYNKGWAKTEYETARLTAESSANYQRLKAQTGLFPFWEYRTVGDDRVREEHEAIDGVILPSDDPRWRKIYPPNGWKCRCRVVPRMKGEVDGFNIAAMRAQVDEYFHTADWSEAQAQGFGINRGETQQVFTANQMYIKKFPQQASKLLDRLTYKNYGLPPLTKCMALAEQSVPPCTEKPEDWFAARAKNSVVTLTDSNRRSLVLTVANFKTHTTKSRESRARYLTALPVTLADPDEIWINAQSGKKTYDNYTVIKYYTDDLLVVNCRVTGGANEIRTWYPMAKKTMVIDKVRRGLLIYKKSPQKEG